MAATNGDVWTMQVLSTGVDYNWPYGTRALIEERKSVRDIERLRGLFLYGHRQQIFIFPMSFEEAFVRSDTERITLMERLRAYYNFNWKRDATARAQFHQSQFEQLKKEADHLFAKRIEDVLLLQGLTEELKPETRELVKRCTSFEELLRCMLDAKVGST